MEIKQIAVIGAGTMGNGIAHVAAQSGYNVQLIDIKQEFLDRAKGAITKNMGRQVKKEIITQADADAALARINFTTGWDDKAVLTVHKGKLICICTDNICRAHN